MGFLMLSVDYPSEKDRSKFVRKAGPHANSSSPFHKPLAASATDDQWRQVLKAIRESVTDTTFLHEQPSPRPLRPNDDNFEVRNETFKLWSYTLGSPAFSHRHLVYSLKTSFAFLSFFTLLEGFYWQQMETRGIDQVI